METKELKQEQKLDYEDFKGLLGGWSEQFKPFIEGKEMWDLYQKIKADAKYDMIVPRSEQVFRAFETCRPENLKVIFYLQDPYPRLYRDKKPQATGIAMDCSNSAEGKIQPSLEKWYDRMDEDLDKKVERSPYLDYLHTQGVMLLNTDLTCKVNKTGSHSRYWEAFQKFFLEEVLRDKFGIIYVLCGKESQQLERYIQPLGNHILFREHPAAASHSHRDWEHQGIFNLINRILSDNKQWEILWDKRDWDLYAEPPF